MDGVGWGESGANGGWDGYERGPKGTEVNDVWRERGDHITRRDRPRIQLTTVTNHIHHLSTSSAVYPHAVFTGATLSSLSFHSRVAIA